MPVFNTGKDSFENDLGAAFEGLQQQRTTLLAAAIDAQLGLRQLADLEARRLEAKRGPSDPRLAILGDRAEALLVRVNALGVERDIASIRTPPVAKTGTLVHGRIVDANLQAAGRVTVRLVDEKGKDVAGVAPVQADDAGYYAFSVPPETVAAVGATAKLSILLQSGTDQLAPAAARPFTIAPDMATVQQVMLGTAELEKLKLRLAKTDVPAPDKPPPRPPAKAKDSKSK